MRAILSRSSGWLLLLVAAAWFCMVAACMAQGDPLVIDAPLWTRLAETNPWVMTRPGELLGAGSQVRSGPAPAGWIYPGGAEVLIAPDSHALLMLPGPDITVIELTRGTLWWRGGSDARDAIIALGAASVTVGAGDEILVEMVPPGGLAAVGVLRGGARVATGTGPENAVVTVMEGQRTLIRPGQPPAQPAGYNVVADRDAYFPDDGPPMLGTTLDRLVRGISPLGPPAVLLPGRLPLADSGLKWPRVVALTFDDGPIRSVTPAILDTLRKLGLKATFFVVGRMVDASPALLRRIVEEGHALANHTFDHARLDRLSDAAVMAEVTRCQESVDRALGRPYPMAMVRPPYGATNARVSKLLRNAGYTLVGWDIDSLDWATRRKGPIISKVLRQTRRHGGILLLHDHVAALPSTLPELVTDLRGLGFTILLDQTRLLAGGLPRMFGNVQVYRRHRYHPLHAAAPVVAARRN